MCEFPGIQLILFDNLSSDELKGCRYLMGDPGLLPLLLSTRLSGIFSPLFDELWPVNGQDGSGSGFEICGGGDRILSSGGALKRSGEATRYAERGWGVCADDTPFREGQRFCEGVWE